ncbi:polyphosphate--glucose phosphotransferase [Herpetosiphon giganteus]|uniref:polyphosphate--glucose phosphotransferase n=1 Tax=Herpetosiphon giganteus TaxID=2029754 RepID=UPI00195C82F7|nr:ROK family protein [Herpetosiphon giganteus]MBM7843845.1 polyphosphate glucokinase [Herpetosiphon giganteus]
MQILGLDIGGTGIKAAPVDCETGKLLAEVERRDTPQPATPDSVLEVVQELVEHFDWQGPIGCGFPAVVQRGIVRTASNIDQRWLHCEVASRFSKHFDREVTVINDADAAGLAEITFGAGREVMGTLLMLTLGTGIGTALFHDHDLVPNLELGQIIVRGKPGHEWAAASVREEQNQSWERWAQGVELFLQTIEVMLWPDLIILGGGVSKDADQFLDRIRIRAKLVPARLTNDAGIIGAALFAAQASPE